MDLTADAIFFSVAEGEGDTAVRRYFAESDSPCSAQRPSPGVAAEAHDASPAGALIEAAEPRSALLQAGGRRFRADDQDYFAVTQIGELQATCLSRSA